ncbi:MAG: PQQ-dependent sugar dehydrogenase [Planctomycetales bacterium]|nr:PQQ-dependent sugar dehydrogenase [Planctomycetales bacterium]
MFATQLSVFILTYLVLALGLSIFTWLRLKTKLAFSCAVFAGTLLLVVAISFQRWSSPVVLSDKLLTLFVDRMWLTILAALCAASTVLPWAALLWQDVAGQKRLTVVLTIVILFGSLSGTAIGFAMFLYEETNDIQLPFVALHADDYVVEEIATFDVSPIRVAVDAERELAFVSYYTEDHQGLYEGGVQQVSTKLIDGKPNRPSLAVSSPLLFRPFGLALRNGDLYVARCGIHADVLNGKITHPNLGRVTRLSDLDNNGTYEYFHDVISDLPGGRSPDAQHQNNELIFDDEGNLFIAIGTNDDRSLDDDPRGGTILKASPDFSEVEVFARGLRNPFGIAVARDDQGDIVFINDNDVRSNRGDELNVARKGDHFGHPFVVGLDKQGKDNGFKDPIWMSRPNSNLNGLAYLGEQFGDLAGKLLAVDQPAHCVYLVQPHLANVESAKSPDVPPDKRFVRVFLNVPTPVDVVATSTGEIYVLTRYYNRLYRVRPKAKS